MAGKYVRDEGCHLLGLPTHRALASCVLSGFVWASKAISARVNGHGDTPIPEETGGVEKILAVAVG